MFAVEVYAAVRQFVFVDGKSRREADRVFGLSGDTIAKMCRYSMPPGFSRQRPGASDHGFLGAIVSRTPAKDFGAVIVQDTDGVGFARKVETRCACRGATEGAL
jgi:hypothetical protein